MPACLRVRPFRRRRGRRPRATAAPRSTVDDRDASVGCSRRDKLGGVEVRLSRSTACTAVPNRLVFSTSGIASSARIAATGSAARTSTIGRPGEDLLHLGGRADRRQPAGVDQRDAVAALGLVEVVRRDEDRDARPATARRSAARTAGATADRRRRSARRGTGSAARGGSRSRARAAGASRRRDRAPASSRGRVRPAISSTNAAPRGEPLPRQAVDAAEEADVLIDGQQLVEREPLRHVADAPLHAFGIARRRRCRRPARVPDVGRSSPHSMRMVVDLPAPLLPRKPKISPRATVERQVVDGDERAEPPGQVPDLDGVRRRRQARRPAASWLSGRRRAVQPRLGQPRARRARACDRARPAAAPVCASSTSVLVATPAVKRSPTTRRPRRRRARRRRRPRSRRGSTRARAGAAAPRRRPAGRSRRRARRQRARAGRGFRPLGAASAAVPQRPVTLTETSHESSHSSMRGKMRGFGRA